MLLNQDLREFIELLNARNVRYVIVGGWAYNFHAPPRATGDFDFFVASDEENDKALRSVLEEFGFGSAIAGKRRLFRYKKVIMLGRQPNRIDLLADIDGVEFEDAWKGGIKAILDGLPVRILSRDLLIRNKVAAARDKDLVDVKTLRKMARGAGASRPRTSRIRKER